MSGVPVNMFIAVCELISKERNRQKKDDIIRQDDMDNLIQAISRCLEN